jgi:uncharacterized protein YjiS (DUF1127 family)
MRFFILRLARFINGFVANVIAQRERQAQLTVLRSLNDRELMDIGLNRCEIGEGLAEAAKARGCDMKIKSAIFLAAFASLAWTTSASAELLHYTLDFINPATPDISWDLNSNPTPSISDANLSFTLDSIANTSSNNPFNLEFFNSGNGGGLAATGFDLAGPQLYSGPESSPTLLAGTFNLTPDGGSDVTAQLVVAAAVPEPSTWAMMILGFAGVGFMAYRRKSRPVLTAV